MVNMAISESLSHYTALVSDNIAVSSIIGIIVLLLLSSTLSAKSGKERHLPVWLPLEIGAAGYLISSGGLGLSIYSSLRRYSGSLFGLTSKHQVIHGLPDLDKFLSKGSHILDGLPRDWALSTRVFGVDDLPRIKEVMMEVVPQMNAMTEKLFVNESNAAAAIERCDIPAKAASLVTFAVSPESQKQWERSANIRILRTGVAEVDMLHLIRDFGACISIPQLYGQDFLNRNPALLDDFWTFDNDLFPLMIIGIPTWLPFKLIKNGIAARSRLQTALAELYKRADQYLKSEPVDFDAYMSDISAVVIGRTKIYNDKDISYRFRGQIDLGNLWGQNANTQPTVFWFLLFIYSTPDLIEELRREIAPYVTLSGTNPPEITSFDLQSLTRSCPLLKGCVYETLRMVDQPTSIRYLNKSVSVPDGKYKHNLAAGTWISASHAIANKDPSIYPEPDKFIPDRFLEADSETGKKAPRYGKLRPWGAGSGICKGRIFAEKEIIAIGAAVMSLWDIGPLGEKWVIPAMRPGTGVAQPVNDIRAVMKRRS